MDFPAQWLEGLVDPRVTSDTVDGDARTLVIEGKSGPWRITRTYRITAGSLEDVIEESDEPMTQAEGGAADEEYVDAVAYFARLFEHGATLEKAGPVEVLSLGAIDLPSGYVLVMSAEDLNPSRPFDGALARPVAPGRYELEQSYGQECGPLAFRCTFSSERTVSFRRATAELVGTGIGAFLWLDWRFLSAAEPKIEELHRAETGTFALGTDATRIACTATSADGGFRLLWGLDATGQATCLVLDAWEPAPEDDDGRKRVP